MFTGDGHDKAVKIWRKKLENSMQEEVVEETVGDTSEGEGSGNSEQSESDDSDETGLSHGSSLGM